MPIPASQKHAARSHRDYAARRNSGAALSPAVPGSAAAIHMDMDFCLRPECAIELARSVHSATTRHGPAHGRGHRYGVYCRRWSDQEIRTTLKKCLSYPNFFEADRLSRADISGVPG